MTREQVERLAKRDALVATMAVIHLQRRILLRRGRIRAYRMGWHHVSSGSRRRRSMGEHLKSN